MTNQSHFARARAFVAVLIALLWTGSLPAAVMVSPTAATTDMGVSDPQQAAVTKMIDHSGLDKPFTSGVTDWDAYFDTGDPPFAQAAGGNNWQSAVDFSLPVSGVVDFDLGAVHPIDRIAIWNISVKDVTIHVSETSFNALTEVRSYSLPNHLNFPFSYPHDRLNFGAVHNARYVRLEIDSVHLFDPNDTFGYAIVGELVAGSVVPEPAAVALVAVVAPLLAARRSRQ